MLVSRVSDESIDHVASDLKFTLVSVEVIAKHLLAKEKLRKDLKLIILEAYKSHLRSIIQLFFVNKLAIATIIAGLQL